MGIITILWEKWREFRRDFYKISIDSDRYQWWNNRRIETLEDAKRCVFELIDWEEPQ